MTFGGVDHYNLSSIVIRIFDLMETKFDLDIVIGPYYENVSQIQALARASKNNVYLHREKQSLSSLMDQSDIAICAGGTTSFEVVASRVPCIAVALWENQWPSVKSLDRLDAILPVYFNSLESLTSDLQSSVHKLVSDGCLRHSLYTNCSKALDGYGARRITNYLLENR